MIPTSKTEVTGVDGHTQVLLESIYREHVDRVYRYCLFRTNSFADAEDIVSETFIRYMRSDRRPANPAEALPWLFKVAGNLCVNHNRRGAHGRRIAEQARRATGHSEEPWRNRDVWSVMQHLKPIQQQVVYLKVVEDLSFKQTAAMVRKREGAVKMIFYRAIKLLQATLSKEDY